MKVAQGHLLRNSSLPDFAFVSCSSLPAYERLCCIDLHFSRSPYLLVPPACPKHSLVAPDPSHLFIPSHLLHYCHVGCRAPRLDRLPPFPAMRESLWSTSKPALSWHLSLAGTSLARRNGIEAATARDEGWQRHLRPLQEWQEVNVLCSELVLTERRSVYPSCSMLHHCIEKSV